MPNNAVRENGSLERKQDLWAVVLAGGRGARLSPLSRKLFGAEVPKQYLPLLTSKKSLLQETLERMARIVPAERTIVVVSKEWLSLASQQLKAYPGVKVVAQPMDKGTTAGILLPLSHVLAKDPQADVLVTASDHHLARPMAFYETVNRLRTSSLPPRSIALVGTRPEYAATDLGWIVPAKNDGGLAPVKSFVEKPALAQARSLVKDGGLWNTFIMFGRASALWSRVFRARPAIAAMMEGYIQQIVKYPFSCDGYCQTLYPYLAQSDFSKDVLGQDVSDLYVATMQAAGWFDCGTPERLFDWLKRTPASDSPFRKLLPAA